MINAKLLGLLAGATVLVAGVAALALSRREGAVTAAQEDERFFPGLIERVNDVATVRVKTAAEEITLQRADDGWTVAEKDGYPAQGEPIRKTLIGLAELRTVEAKTDDPERWSKLGVEDLDAEGAASKLVTLADGSGAELAALIVGNQRPSQGGRPISEHYVRKPGHERAWLVEGELDLRASQKDWISKEILKVPPSRVCSIEVRHPDGETLRVHKASKEDANFAVLGLAEGQELQYPTIAGTVAGALDYLNLDDVQRAGQIDFETDWLAVATFWTFDGLRVRVTTKELDGKTYARFEAAYDLQGANPYAGPAAPEPAGDEPKAADEGAADGGEAVAGETGGGEAGEDDEEQGTAPEEVKAEAEKLQARLAVWTYVIPPYSRTYFTKRLKDLLKPPAPPAPPADEELGAEGDEDKPYLIPDTLPPEIQQQIKEHQESIGNKVIIRPPDEPPGDPDAPEPPEEDVDPDADEEHEPPGARTL